MVFLYFLSLGEESFIIFEQIADEDPFLGNLHRIHINFKLWFDSSKF